MVASTMLHYKISFNAPATAARHIMSETKASAHRHYRRKHSLMQHLVLLIYLNGQKQAKLSSYESDYDDDDIFCNILSAYYRYLKAYSLPLCFSRRRPRISSCAVKLARYASLNGNDGNTHRSTRAYRLAPLPVIYDFGEIAAARRFEFNAFQVVGRHFMGRWALMMRYYFLTRYWNIARWRH